MVLVLNFARVAVLSVRLRTGASRVGAPARSLTGLVARKLRLLLNLFDLAELELNGCRVRPKMVTMTFMVSRSSLISSTHTVEVGQRSVGDAGPGSPFSYLIFMRGFSLAVSAEAEEDRADFLSAQRARLVARAQKARDRRRVFQHMPKVDCRSSISTRT